MESQQRMEPVPRDALECPICVEIPQAEIFQCLSGHSFCVTCSTQFDKCPVCKVSLVPGVGQMVRNRFMEELIGCTKLPCKYKEEGCDKVLVRRDSAAHFQTCEFQPFQLCQKLPAPAFRQCPFQSSKASQIFDHLAEDPHKLDILTTRASFINLTPCVDPLKQSYYSHCLAYLFQLNSPTTAGEPPAKYLLWIRFSFPRDASVMVLYMGDKVKDDVSPFFVELEVKAISEEDTEWTWIWKGRPVHYKTVDAVVKSPPLKMCLQDLFQGIVSRGWPKLKVNFYEK